MEAIYWKKIIAVSDIMSNVIALNILVQYTVLVLDVIIMLAIFFSNIMRQTFAGCAIIFLNKYGW